MNHELEALRQERSQGQSPFTRSPQAERSAAPRSSLALISKRSVRVQSGAPTSWLSGIPYARRISILSDAFVAIYRPPGGSSICAAVWPDLFSLTAATSKTTGVLGS